MLTKVDIYVFVNDVATCDNLPICANVVEWANGVTPQLGTITEGKAFAYKYKGNPALESQLQINAPYHVLFLDGETDTSLVVLKPDQVNKANIEETLLRLDGGFINGDGKFETEGGLIVGNDEVLQLIPGLGLKLFNFSIPPIIYLWLSVAAGVAGVISKRKVPRIAFGIASVALGAIYTRKK